MLVSSLVLFPEQCLHLGSECFAASQEIYLSLVFGQRYWQLQSYKLLSQGASWESNTDTVQNRRSRGVYMSAHENTSGNSQKWWEDPVNNGLRSCIKRTSISQWSIETLLQLYLHGEGTCEIRHLWGVPAGHSICQWSLDSSDSLSSLSPFPVAPTKDAFRYPENQDIEWFFWKERRFWWQSPLHQSFLEKIRNYP